MTNEKDLLVRVAYLELQAAQMQQSLTALSSLVMAALAPSQSEAMQQHLKEAQALFLGIAESVGSANAKSADAARERLRALGENI